MTSQYCSAPTAPPSPSQSNFTLSQYLSSHFKNMTTSLGMERNECRRSRVSAGEPILKTLSIINALKTPNEIGIVHP